MELTVYWSNLFISFSVLVVSWFLTKCSSMECIGMALVAFVSANILENLRRYIGVAPIASSLRLAAPKRVNPRGPCLDEKDLGSKKTEKSEKSDVTQKTAQEIDD